MHEPRGKQGLGLSYATSPRGATHMEGLHDTMLETENPSPEIGVTRSYDRFTLDDKPAPVVIYENLRSFDNALILCVFTSRGVGEAYSYPLLRSLLEAATGTTLDADEMLRVGARNSALMRILSGRAGHRIDADGLPARFAEPMTSGASADHVVDSGELKRAIAECYELRGYDAAGPTDERLAELDMHDCVGRIPRG
jgi:aldehyde:ferredoxin oxidoreductase